VLCLFKLILDCKDNTIYKETIHIGLKILIIK